MRERLALAFGSLAVAVLLLAGGLRLVALQNLLAEESRGHLDEHARIVAAVLDGRAAADEQVTRRVVARVLDDSTRLRLVPADGGAPLVLEGADYAGNGEDDVVAREDSRAGTVTLTIAAPGTFDLYAEDRWSLLMLGALVTLLAGLAGWWLASRLSRPFTALAAAAAALGRGRFDLSLPDSRVPEVRAVGQALAASAAQLQARISRERDFAEHASHVLRTPLTGLRLELEDLTLRDDVPEDVQEAARRCIERVDAVNASAGELVALTRSTALVEGAETTVEDLARQVAQQWSDQLGDRRPVSAAVEGDHSLRLTPGPVEHVLDLVLPDVRRGHGPVRLVFVGEDSHLRVRLTGRTVPGGASQRAGVTAARAVAEAQGGRVTEHAHERDVEVLLPRR